MDTSTPQVPQQPTVQQSAPQTPPMMPPSTSNDSVHKPKIMLVIGIVVVLLLLAFVAYSLRGSLVAQNDSPAPLGEPATQNRDTTASIENDLKATDISNLDKELDAIGTELNAPKK